MHPMKWIMTPYLCNMLLNYIGNSSSPKATNPECMLCGLKNVMGNSKVLKLGTFWEGIITTQCVSNCHQVARWFGISLSLGMANGTCRWNLCLTYYKMELIIKYNYKRSNLNLKDKKFKMTKKESTSYEHKQMSFMQFMLMLEG